MAAGDEGWEPNEKGLEGAFEGAPNENDGVVVACPNGVEVATAADWDDDAPNGFDAGVDGVCPNAKGEDVLPDDWGG